MIKTMSALGFFLLSLAQVAQAQSHFSVDELQKHSNSLNNNKLLGRHLGSAGNKKAAAYIADEFKTAGISFGFGETYIQKPASGINLKQANSHKLIIDGKKESPENFTALPFSAAGRSKGLLVFGGYGLFLPDIELNSYENLDVTGQWVLLIQDLPYHLKDYQPAETSCNDYQKALLAAQNGAIGVLLVSNSACNPQDVFPVFRPNAYSKLPIPVIQIKRKLAERLLNQAGEKLNELEQPINTRSFGLKNTLEANIKTHKNIAPAPNIAGLIKQNNSMLQKKYLLLTANYNHLGFGCCNSLANMPNFYARYKGATQKCSHNS